MITKLPQAIEDKFLEVEMLKQPKTKLTSAGQVYLYNEWDRFHSEYDDLLDLIIRHLAPDIADRLDALAEGATFWYD